MKGKRSQAWLPVGSWPVMARAQRGMAGWAIVCDLTGDTRRQLGAGRLCGVCEVSAGHSRPSVLSLCPCWVTLEERLVLTSWPGVGTVPVLCAHTHAHAFSGTCTCTHRCSCSHIGTFRLSRAHSHTHTCTHVHTYTHTHLCTQAPHRRFSG